MLTLNSDHAIIPYGRKFATVVEEPCLKETMFRGQPDYIMHFLARGQSQELIHCCGTHERARIASQELNIGDRVIVDVSVKITPIENTLEYEYSGYYICTCVK